jgi:nitrate reductase gamma subunit
MSYLHSFVFGIYPYIALTVFLLGSLVRFEREQYTWKSESLQVLHGGSLRLGNILFHIGILGLFFGHMVGLLTPVLVWEFLGITHSLKQMIAMLAGGIMGVITLVGLLILLIRRAASDRLAFVRKPGDRLLMPWILITLLLGLATLFESASHLDGHMMVQLMIWAQSVFTLRGLSGAEVILNAPLLFKAHLFMGMTLFLIFPFTRLVHVWSGFASLTYLGRAWQLVRPR